MWLVVLSFVFRARKNLQSWAGGSYARNVPAWKFSFAGVSRTSHAQTLRGKNYSRKICAARAAPGIFCCCRTPVELTMPRNHPRMSEPRHPLRKLKALKFFIVPLAGLAFEIWRWRRQDVLHRIIFCAVVAVLFAFALIWLESSRRAPRPRRRRQRRDDFR